MNESFDVIVIGGGAAGMMSAITAAECGARVLLAERNQMLGKKLSITGKGRCNVTNNSDNSNIMKNIPTNSRFLYSALAGFSAYDTIDFFEGLGVPLKTERGNRVFPVSDKASDIVKALKDRMSALGVTVKTMRADRILTESGAAVGVKCGKDSYYAPKIILATGGMSYPGTGSTGDGYKMARALGHTVTELKPSLVPVCTAQDCKPMMGLSLKNVTLSLKDSGGKVLYSELGEMLFTHFGVSGPLVLSASAFIKKGDSYTLEIDLKPALDEKKLDARILRDFSEAKNKQLSTVMRKLLPEKLIDAVLTRAEVPADMRVNEITKEKRKSLVAVLKSFSLTVSGLRPIEEAIITDGGISVKEINPKTMESKLVSGLFFAGEIIDCAAYTGGYNLQIAFSTARLAGQP